MVRRSGGAGGGRRGRRRPPPPGSRADPRRQRGGPWPIRCPGVSFGACSKWPCHFSWRRWARLTYTRTSAALIDWSTRARPGIPCWGYRLRSGDDRRCCRSAGNQGTSAPCTSPNDRRLRLLILEVKGEALLLRLAASVGRAQERILAPLSAKEGRQFMTLLTKLVVKNNERSRAPMRPVTQEKRLAAAQPRVADGARGTSRPRRLRASPVA